MEYQLNNSRPKYDCCKVDTWKTRTVNQARAWVGLGPRQVGRVGSWRLTYQISISDMNYLEQQASGTPDHSVQPDWCRTDTAADPADTSDVARCGVAN